MGRSIRMKMSGEAGYYHVISRVHKVPSGYCITRSFTNSRGLRPRFLEMVQDVLFYTSHPSGLRYN